MRKVTVETEKGNRLEKILERKEKANWILKSKEGWRERRKERDSRTWDSCDRKLTLHCYIVNLLPQDLGQS